MECIAADGEALHVGVADLDAFFVALVSSAVSTLRPVLVVVAAISSTMAARLVGGRSRQFCVMRQNSRCSILFHFDVPGGYLPPYSPDLNPIEMALSKLKAHLRKAAEHIIPGLLRRIGSVVRTFNPQECTNFFRHAGYVQT
jgi:DDE superfamily endonuclease